MTAAGSKDARSKEARRNGSLIPAERLARVLEFVRRQGVASIHSIADELGTSLSTVRRDLDELTARGYLDRTHGGAVLRSRQQTTFEPSRDIAGNMAVAQKAAIGRHAASLIEPGQSVLFDSSSTVLEAARAVVARGIHFTAITNDLAIAQEFAAAASIKTIVPGGTLRPGSVTLTGEPTLDLLRRLRVDMALIGIHSMAGLKVSETSLEVAAVKRAMVEAARRVLLLADSSKFESPAFCEVGPLDLFDDLITDTGISAELCVALDERGVQVAAVGEARPS